ncbi:MAG: hypothetical protein HC817_07035 [Saprospiraceae bacterium]|nr:hypothetical protein [Saprospiraceae bacterium]
MIISSLFFIAFSGGVFARHMVEPIKKSIATVEAVEKKQKIDVKKKDEVKKIVEVECVYITIPVCDNGQPVGSVTWRFCGNDPYAIAESFTDCN